MNKQLLKKRKLFLLIAMIIVAVGIIISIIKNLKLQHYIDDAQQAAPTLKMEGNTSTMLTIVFAIVLPWIFYIFAGIYIFSKNSRVQNRKWPYIVMIVFASIGILMSVVYMAIYAKDTGAITIKNATDAETAAVSKVWADSYKSTFKVLLVISAILSIAIIVLHSIQIALIKKSKNNADVDYSEQIKNFQQQPQNNDLP